MTDHERRILTLAGRYVTRLLLVEQLAYTDADAETIRLELDDIDPHDLRFVRDECYRLGREPTGEVTGGLGGRASAAAASGAASLPSITSEAPRGHPGWSVRCG